MLTVPARRVMFEVMERLEEAIKDILRGLSYSMVIKQYGIPRASLFRAVQKAKIVSDKRDDSIVGEPDQIPEMVEVKAMPEPPTIDTAAPVNIELTEAHDEQQRLSDVAIDIDILMGRVEELEALLLIRDAELSSVMTGRKDLEQEKADLSAQIQSMSANLQALNDKFQRLHLEGKGKLAVRDKEILNLTKLVPELQGQITFLKADSDNMHQKYEAEKKTILDAAAEKVGLATVEIAGYRLLSIVGFLTAGSILFLIVILPAFRKIF